MDGNPKGQNAQSISVAQSARQRVLVCSECRHRSGSCLRGRPATGTATCLTALARSCAIHRDGWMTGPDLPRRSCDPAMVLLPAEMITREGWVQ